MTVRLQDRLTTRCIIVKRATRVAPKHLVVVFAAALELAHWARHNAWELGVHGHIRILIYNAADDGHLALQVPLPYLAT